MSEEEEGEEDEEEDILSLAEEKYRPAALEKMIALISLLVEQSRSERYRFKNCSYFTTESLIFYAKFAHILPQKCHISPQNGLYFTPKKLIFQPKMAYISAP